MTHLRDRLLQGKGGCNPRGEAQHMPPHTRGSHLPAVQRGSGSDMKRGRGRGVHEIDNCRPRRWTEMLRAVEASAPRQQPGQTDVGVQLTHLHGRAWCSHGRRVAQPHTGCRSATARVQRTAVHGPGAFPHRDGPWARRRGRTGPGRDRAWGSCSVVEQGGTRRCVRRVQEQRRGSHVDKQQKNT